MKKYTFPLNSLLILYEHEKNQKGIELSKIMQKWNLYETKKRECDIQIERNLKYLSDVRFYRRSMQYIDSWSRLRREAEIEQKKIQIEIEQKREEFNQANLNYKKIETYKDKHKDNYDYNISRLEQNIQDDIFSNQIKKL